MVKRGTKRGDAKTGKKMIVAEVAGMAKIWEHEDMHCHLKVWGTGRSAV